MENHRVPRLGDNLDVQRITAGSFLREQRNFSMIPFD